ncbi:MAG: gas vesicle protein GvpO [Solirubrobacteraceae bacterium]
MAERRRAGSRNNGGSSKNGISALDAVKQVREQLPALLGKPIESVLGAEHDDDGGWRVTVAVVELARIPNSTDVLGAYVVTLGDDGELIGYGRRRRYARAQADEDQP